jgi:hypothetical protein
VGALLTTDTDTELVPDWMARMPFGMVAVAFVEPLRLFDGQRWCRYLGFIACGTQFAEGQAVSPAGNELPRSRLPDGMTVHTGVTYYGPLSAEAEGIRFLWVFDGEGDGADGAQTVTAFLAPRFGKAPSTVRGLIGHVATMLGQEGGGLEAEVLVPLGLSIVMYLASADPDLDELPPERVVRPQELTGARVIDLGWRVGAALRTARTTDPSEAEVVDDDELQPSLVGWRLPPHFRRAHWHRVRVATRDDEGKVVGDRLGRQDIDWHYELRWYPPTPVNIEAPGALPAVRDIE